MTITKPSARSLVVAVVLLAAVHALAEADSGLDSPTATSGLKEALQVGTGKAVDLLGQVCIDAARISNT